MTNLHGQCNYAFIRIARFWVVTQREAVISYRRFGATYRYHLQGFITTALFCVITRRVVVTPYRRFGSHYSLHNKPEKRSPQLLGGGSLKPRTVHAHYVRLRLKCGGTHAETRFRLSPKRTSPFKSAGYQFSRVLAAEVCASAVVMLDTPCSEVV